MLGGDSDDDWRLLKMGEGGMIGDDDECLQCSAQQKVSAAIIMKAKV
jgi:hypothetical protein